MNITSTKFFSPVLGNGTQELYTKLYGDAGEKILDTLNTSPDEIAVISRMIAYLKDKKGEKQYGHTENS